MKIKLHIPPEGLAAIKALGLRQASPRRCAWSSITRTPATASAYCCAAKAATRWAAGTLRRSTRALAPGSSATACAPSSASKWRW